jgi:regulator of sigma E protease
VTWLLAFAGFAVLIVLHEAGHFVAAKAVGMRVERFSLFFGPPLASFRRGETEYRVGAIPLGGYVKITGMSPLDRFPDHVAHRAYYRQPVWRRIVVIAAGPAVNVVLAFLILWGLLTIHGVETTTRRVDTHGLKPPAAQVLRPGDRIVSVDGAGGSFEAIAKAVGKHACAGKPVEGCVATSAAHVVVQRGGSTAAGGRGRLAFDIRPRYSAAQGRMLLGIQYATAQDRLGPVHAVGRSVSYMWYVTKRSVSVFARLFEAKERKQVGSVVGAYKVTQESFGQNVALAFQILALISLSLAIINLFPFLPLDGGHIFWALVEKVRGRAVPFAIIERASMIGFALVLMLFVIGLSNDIGRLQSGSFNVR